MPKAKFSRRLFSSFSFAFMMIKQLYTQAIQTECQIRSEFRRSHRKPTNTTPSNPTNIIQRFTVGCRSGRTSQYRPPQLIHPFTISPYQSINRPRPNKVIQLETLLRQFFRILLHFSISMSLKYNSRNFMFLQKAVLEIFCGFFMHENMCSMDGIRFYRIRSARLIRKFAINPRVGYNRKCAGTRQSDPSLIPEPGFRSDCIVWSVPMRSDRIHYRICAPEYFTYYTMNK